MTTTTDDGQVGTPLFDLAEWLIERRHAIDANESAWLDVLAEFDLAQGWAVDGRLSCVDWLTWRLKMARSTAFEKVRIAHALRQRPAVAAAYASGEISYSAVRAITRLDRPSAEVDEALIALAVDGTVAQLEWAVRVYQLHEEQDRPEDASQRRYDRRGVRIARGLNGLGTVEIRLTDVEVEEFAVTLRAFTDPNPVDGSSAEATIP